MNYLVDTNVLSELRRKAPDPGVLAWFAAQPARRLYLSVLTLGELRKGIDALPEGHKRAALQAWLETDLPRFFLGRVLMLDAPVADCWGRLLAQTGRPVPAIDSLIAATALHHGLTLVTRNTRDFEFPGLAVLNPWAQ